MRRLLRTTGLGLLALVGLAAVLVGIAYAVSARRLAHAYPTDVRAVAMRTDAGAVADGRHIADIRGCFDCHGADYGGKTMDIPAPVATISGSNLTRGGRTATWTDADFTRAIRNGVDPDGRPLLIMPSSEYHHLSDADVGALIAFLRSLPAVTRDLPDNRLGPIGRVLHVTGKAPLAAAELIAAGQAVPAVAVSATSGPVERGQYLASSCIGCHGADFGGQKMAGMPPGTPPAANLTPHAQGLGRYDAASFATVLRTGTRPDGTTTHPMMPIAMTSKLTDAEVADLWAFFSSLPPVAPKK